MDRKDELRKKIENYRNTVNTSYLEDDMSVLDDLIKTSKMLLNTDREEKDNKFKFPDSLLFDEIEEFTNFKCPNKHQLLESLRRLHIFINMDNKIDKDLGEELFELYNNPNVSMGVHGAYHFQDFDASENSPYLTKGIRCRYGNANRTVSFQDRGKVHAHGNISFLDLITYSYGKQSERYDL